ncbi:hypothetical protein [Trueperella pyogenes]
MENKITDIYTPNTVWAFGLDNGECPVGVVEKVTSTHLQIGLYDWCIHLFLGSSIVIRVSDIAYAVKAEFQEGSTRVLEMDPLAEHQIWWEREHKPNKADLRGGDAA